MLWKWVGIQHASMLWIGQVLNTPVCRQESGTRESIFGNRDSIGTPLSPLVDGSQLYPRQDYGDQYTTIVMKVKHTSMLWEWSRIRHASMLWIGQVLNTPICVRKAVLVI